MPRMHVPTPETPVESPVPRLDDDLADPPVPADLQEGLQEAPGSTEPPPPTQTWAEHEALLVGFCSALQGQLRAFMLDEHKTIMSTLDATLVAMKRWVETVGSQNEHASYQLSDALLKLQETGLPLRHDPYIAEVQALSPQGFPVTIRLAKHTTGDLVAALPLLMEWLGGQGYKPV